MVFLSRRFPPIVVFFTWAALVGFLIFHLFMAASTASAQDKITPFVLETEIYGFEHDPHGAVGIKTTFARRSDGADVSVENVGPLTMGITGRRIWFMDGRSVSVVDAFKMKTMWPAVSAGQVERFNAQRLRTTPDCVKAAGEVWAGAGTVAGQGVELVVTETPIYNGQRTRKETEWRAPALGCRTLTYKVEDQQADGSWFLRTEGRVVSLKLEEPDPKLFDDGAGYAEVKPSEIERKIREILGNPLDQAGGNQKAGQAQDRVTMIVIRGNARIPASTIRKNISIEVGDIYDPAMVERAVSALKNTGYFDDVREVTSADPSGTKGGTMVIFYVREKKAGSS
jgi:hypothetical protein